MDNSHFTLSDFLGYVIPGASVLVVMLMFYHYPDEDYTSVDDLLRVIKKYSYLLIDKSAKVGVILPSFFVILSYVAGHILAYLSSITVERFAIWIYGYPSEYLFSKVGWSHLFEDVNRVRKKRPRCWVLKSFMYLLIRIIIIVVLFPLSSAVFFIKAISIDGFLVKNLDPFLRDVIAKKLTSLRAQLNLPNDKDYKGADLHRIVHEYCYCKYDCIRQKMDNYVAIYDLMRSLTLIMVFVSWMLAYANIKYIKFLAPINWGTLFMIGIVLMLTLLCFMAFMKFYRRYTLESYICIASDKDL